MNSLVKDSRTIYRIAAWSAMLAALLVPVSLFVYIKYPPPYGGTAGEWFNVFNDNWLVGLISMDLPLLLIWLLLIPVYGAAYLALRQIRPLLGISGLVIFFVALAAYIASNPMLEMLSLSRQYASSSGADRQAVLGAGEAMAASFDGTAFHVSYILGQLAGILIGWLMLHAKIFKRITAWLLIIGSAVGYALYIPVVGVAISAFSGVILWAWFGFVARDFFGIRQAER